MLSLIWIVTLTGIVSIFIASIAPSLWKFLLFLLPWDRTWTSTFVLLVMKLSFLTMNCKGSTFFINDWSWVSSLTTLFSIVTDILTSEALDMREILLLHLCWNLLISNLNGNLRLGNPVKSMFNLQVDLLDCIQKTASESQVGAWLNLKCGDLQIWIHRKMCLIKASWIHLFSQICGLDKSKLETLVSRLR